MLLMQQRTKSHIQRRDWLENWAEHENAPAAHAAALRRLHENRSAGRYAGQEGYVLFGGDEFERAQASDGVVFEGALVFKVELFQRFTGREACRANPALTAVGLAGGDLTLQAGRQKLFMAPVLRAGAIG
jgi:hypothetical protein